MTTSAIPIYSQSETFYVPRFEVSVGGEKLQSNVVDDILQVTYKDSINDIDSFSIEINNWDADKRQFKFAPPQQGYEGVFDPGKKIEIKMGYYKNLRRMMRGVITGLQPNFPESGASTLSVTGLNELHLYRTEQHTYSWINQQKTDTDIAKDLCGRPVKKGQPGLGLAIDTNPSPDEQPFPIVYMKTQYDIVFLLELARRNGYEMYLEDEAATPTLFFGLTDNPDAPTYQLEWGKSLISFRPTLTTAAQVGNVEVWGWDRTANKPITGKYSLQQLWKDDKKSQSEIARLNQIAKAYANRTEVVTDKPVFKKSDADDLAQSILRNKNNRMIVASGATVGLPDLRSGCAIQILGLGIPASNSGASTQGASCDFNGEYFVEESTHTIGGSGYRTEFSARWKKALDQT
jgi:phage protein D